MRIRGSYWLRSRERVRWDPPKFGNPTLIPTRGSESSELAPWSPAPSSTSTGVSRSRPMPVSPPSVPYDKKMKAAAAGNGEGGRGIWDRDVGSAHVMSEARDPAIKLFRLTIPPQNGQGTAEPPGESSSPSERDEKVSEERRTHLFHLSCHLSFVFWNQFRGCFFLIWFFCFGRWRNCEL